MEMHQLRYFCAVAQIGNFTRAAEQQHVAQPSLSQQILKLEDELGAKLFDRLGRSVRLTQFGNAFLPRAESVLRQLGKAKIEIQEMSGIEKGAVVMGAIPTVAPYFLPAKLASFSSQHPGIQLTVLEDLTSVLLERLYAGKIDLLLLALPVPGEKLRSEEIFSEPLFLVVPRNHHLAGQKSASLKEIQGERFLLMKEGHCFRENMIAACRRSQVKPAVVFESGQFSTILAMVAAGMGVSVVPEMAIESRPGCEYVPIADRRATRAIGLVTLKNHFCTRAQRTLAAHLKRKTND